MLDLIELFLLLVILVSSMSIIKCAILSERKKYPPGPWGFPFVGHLPLFRPHPPATFQKWRDIYGDIFMIRMGRKHSVVLNGYYALKAVLERPDDAFSSRPTFLNMKMVKEVNDNKDDVAFGPFNQSYLQLRKLTVNALNRITSTNKVSTQSLILEETALVIDTFLSWKGEPNFFDREIQVCIGSILHQVLYGREQNVREDKGFQICVSSANEFARLSGGDSSLDVMPCLKYVIPWRASHLYQILKRSADIRYQYATNHKKTFDKNQVRCDITDLFLAADLPDETDDESVTVTKERLVRSLDTLAGAGLETTTAVLIWLLTYMVVFPDVQTNVQKELDKVIGCSRNVELNDRPKLPYTEATIQEVMRVTSAVPISIPHYTIKDVQVNGYDIDKGTVVLMNFHSVHMDETFWKNPQEFQPQRLLNSANELDKDKCSRIIPFGLGRRRCVGERLAKMELFLMFATLMQRCRFEKTDDVPVDLGQKPGLVYKAIPVKMVVYAR